MMAGIETANHHGSHRDLIWQGDELTPTLKVDAIIVPTARKVAYLKEAADAALSLGCPLVTLHSGKWTSAFAAAARLDPAVNLIAIDVPESADLRVPELATSGLLAGTMFERRTDVSTKRNLGLMLSHALRWKRVVFLDDDIRVPNPADLSLAAGLLNSHSAVGLGIGGFPDNSMVCHAFREAGGWQETFIGGGALAVGVKRNRSFFPNVYNEDWFFVLNAGKRLQPVATVGNVIQYPYDPYRAERARGEEFGDVLAEGTFWLLDQGKPASDGDLSHWRDFLAHRRQFIAQVQGMVESTASIGATTRARMGEALRAALGRCAVIPPQLCADYMKALATDQDRWERHIQQIRRQSQMSREEALRSLTVKGKTPLTWYTRNTSASESRATRRREPLTTPVPGWRVVRPGELQVAIPLPPQALVPRGFTAPGQASPLPPHAGVSRPHPAHAAATAKIAQAGQRRHADGDADGDADGNGSTHPPHTQSTACSDGLQIGFHVKEIQLTGPDHPLKGVAVLRPNISIILPDQWRILKALRLDALKDSPNAFLGSYDRESEWSPGQWRAECDASTWVSAALAEKLVGVAKLARSNDPDVTLHIESMWVNPGWRRRGIAQALVGKLEVLAREQGEEILGLWTFDGNESARLLYLRLGFHPVGEKGNRQLITQPSEPGSLIWEEELRKNLVGAPQAGVS